MVENINNPVEQLINLLDEIFKLSEIDQIKEYFDSKRIEIEIILGKKTAKEIYNILKLDEIDIEKLKGKIYFTIVNFKGRELANEYIEKFTENKKDELKILGGSKLPYFRNDDNIENIFKVNTQIKIKILDTNIIQVLSKKDIELPSCEKNSMYICPLEILIELLTRQKVMKDDRRLDFIFDNREIIITSSNIFGYDFCFLNSLFKSFNERKNNENRQAMFNFFNEYQERLKDEKEKFLKGIRKYIFLMYTECFRESFLSIDEKKYNELQQKIVENGFNYKYEEIEEYTEEDLEKAMFEHKKKFLKFFKNLEAFKGKKLFTSESLDTSFYNFIVRFLQENKSMGKKEIERSLKFFYFIFLNIKKSCFISKKLDEIKIVKIDDNTIFDIIISSFTPIFEETNSNTIFGNERKYLLNLKEYDGIEIITNDNGIKNYIKEYNLFILKEYCFEKYTLTDYFKYTPVLINDYISKLK